MNTNHAVPGPDAHPGWLFEGDDSPASAAASPCTEPAEPSTPRLRYAQRYQGEFRLVVLDRLLPADHQARLVWDYVCQLDLTPVLQRIRALAGVPGRDATDPRILFC